MERLSKVIRHRVINDITFNDGERIGRELKFILDYLNYNSDFSPILLNCSIPYEGSQYDSDNIQFILDAKERICVLLGYNEELDHFEYRYCKIFSVNNLKPLNVFIFKDEYEIFKHIHDTDSLYKGKVNLC